MPCVKVYKLDRSCSDNLACGLTMPEPRCIWMLFSKLRGAPVFRRGWKSCSDNLACRHSWTKSSDTVGFSVVRRVVRKTAATFFSISVRHKRFQRGWTSCSDNPFEIFRRLVRPSVSFDCLVLIASVPQKDFQRAPREHRTKCQKAIDLAFGLVVFWCPPGPPRGPKEFGVGRIVGVGGMVGLQSKSRSSSSSKRSSSISSSSNASSVGMMRSY